MNTPQQEQGRHCLIIGLLAGTCVGAGLAMWLAPRGAAELGRRLTGSARSLGEQASDRYQQTRARVSDAVDTLVQKGRDVRDDVAGAVAHGAHGVEEYATASKSDHR